MKTDIPGVGEKVPDFAVPTADNEIFQLRRALAAGENIMLVFYRGHW